MISILYTIKTTFNDMNRQVSVIFCALLSHIYMKMYNMLD